MSAARTVVLLLLSLLLPVHCTAFRPAAPIAAGEPSRAVHLINIGWHTGLALRRADIPAGPWPESADFPAAVYLEVGWGDRDFYQAPAFDPWLAVKAALLPTSAVLHVVGFDDAPDRYFGSAEIIRIDLSRPSFERLVAFIDDAYDRRGAARASPIGPGLYGNSLFYPATGSFHLFNNCNVWVARGLRRAGLPVVPFWAVTADNLFSQARKFGRIEHSQTR
jgi:uncharacterized protein (TIGR02117 family)